MSRALKILAIAALLATIAASGVVLYGINTLSPVVEQTSVLATEAAKAQDVFDSVMEQIRNDTFTGRMFAEDAHLSAEECTFLTYTMRLKNRGFFPAEWISFEIHPQQSADGSAGDVLQLDNNGPNALYAGSTGDIAATILCKGDGGQRERAYTITCYVFGKQRILQGTVR